MHRGPRLWAIILAGGTGRRMTPLTRALGNEGVPKQFANLGARRTFLQETVERLLPVIPASRILVVVTAGQELTAAHQLVAWDEIEVVIQPHDRGTASAVLLAMTRLRARDASGRVAVLPADHHMDAPSPFLEAIDHAVASTRWNADELCLLGAVPDDAAGEETSIALGPPLHRFGLHAIDRIIDEPMRAGDPLWSTSTVVATAASLWHLLADRLPEHGRTIEGCIGSARSPSVVASRLDEVYLKLPAASFEATIARAATSFSALPFARSGWSDLDTPRAFFRRRGANDALLRTERVTRQSMATLSM
jgi:mannose-1-phosphate guanylyltransferase